jgi:hypothetical protein
MEPIIVVDEYHLVEKMAQCDYRSVIKKVFVSRQDIEIKPALLPTNPRLWERKKKNQKRY